MTDGRGVKVWVQHTGSVSEGEGAPLTRIQLVRARLEDFFAHRTPWHRRLWNIGTSLSVREVIEYADACIAGASPNTEGLRFVISSASREVARDPGVAPLGPELDRCLQALATSSSAKVPRSARDELEQLARRVDKDYLANWATTNTQPLEFTARAFASHLLDGGFSPDHLHRWIRATGDRIHDLPELAQATQEMVGRLPIRSYEVFVPCAAPYRKPSAAGATVRWVDGNDAAAWLRDRVPDDEPRRHGGGFILQLEHRDPWAAVDAARVIVARADARVRVARPSNKFVRLDGWARIAGDKRSYDIRSTARQVEIGSLYRQDAVYRFDDGLPTETDDALELASYMESPSAGTAVTGGWAAIEALLIRPGEGSHHTAADRLAALVACSLPRAELTSLAYRHNESGVDDELAKSIGRTATNLEKVELVERHLREGGSLVLSEPSDIAAQERVKAVINDPAAELGRIHTYVTESPRRLYNQRNTISHSGSLRSIALSARPSCGWPAPTAAATCLRCWTDRAQPTRTGPQLLNRFVRDRRASSRRSSA